MSTLLAAQIYGFFTLIVILFQLALASGAPWGHLAMGGKFPGKYPRNMRIVSIIMAILLGWIAWVVFVKAGLTSPNWHAFSTTAIWGVVIFNTLGLVMNLATPSKWERILWSPVVLVFLICSLVVATSSNR